MQTEAALQQQAFIYYNNKYCLTTHSPRCMIFAIPNGGTRNVREAMLLKATGLYPGVSDLILVHYRQMICMEAKTITGTQSKEQKKFQLHCIDCGIPYHVFRTLDEFKSIIDSYTTK